MNLEKSVAGLLNVPHEATFTYFQESPQKVSRNDMSQILEVLFIWWAPLRWPAPRLKTSQNTLNLQECVIFGYL